MVGYPHDIKGEGVFAFVVLKDKGKKLDRTVIEKELRSICRTQIASYAVPDFILVYMLRLNFLFKHEGTRVCRL